MLLDSVGLTDVGQRRAANEDSFLVDHELDCCLLADGIGGHEKGEVASAMAIEGLRYYVARHGARAPQTSDPATRRRYVVELAALMREWVRRTNRAIFDAGTRVGEGRRMGSTLAAVLMRADLALIVHVGDSRVYRLRDGCLEGLTRDHSLANDHAGRPLSTCAWRQLGERAKHVITRALGIAEDVRPELQILDVRPGDLFLLCSDGLTDMLKDAEIEFILNAFGGRKHMAARCLVEAANSRGGLDNITVILAQACDQRRAAGAKTVNFREVGIPA